MTPFKSAAATLQIFSEMGIIDSKVQPIIERAIELLNESREPLKQDDAYSEFCDEVPSHHLLGSVFRNLKVIKGTPIDLVFRLVLF